MGFLSKYKKSDTASNAPAAPQTTTKAWSTARPHPMISPVSPAFSLGQQAQIAAAIATSTRSTRTTVAFPSPVSGKTHDQQQREQLLLQIRQEQLQLLQQHHQQQQHHHQQQQTFRTNAAHALIAASLAGGGGLGLPLRFPQHGINRAGLVHAGLIPALPFTGTAALSRTRSPATALTLLRALTSRINSTVPVARPPPAMSLSAAPLPLNSKASRTKPVSSSSQKNCSSKKVHSDHDTDARANNSENGNKPSAISEKENKNQDFLKNLRLMLSHTELIKIVCWSLPEKTSWTIFNRKQFVRKVLPRFFDNMNYNCFLRGLQTAGFGRGSKGGFELDVSALYCGLIHSARDTITC
jgi:hypothetical protein